MLFTKTKMSEMVGWSEGNGRRWVKEFKEYIPFVKQNKRIMYNNESVRILQFLKDLGQTGLTMSEIKVWVKENGIHENESESKEIINESKINPVSHKYDDKVAKTIPSAKDILIPYLHILSDGESKLASEVTNKIINYFNLSETQQVMKYENSQDSVFLSRIRSVRYSLKKEGYIDEVNKLTYQITDEGLDLLNDSTKEIENEIEELDKVIDPLEVVKEKIKELSNQLADTLLKQLQSVHWIKFEDIVVELLTVMGYGDGEVSQRSNDEGLDGVIKEDKLGLENIYVQAKRWGAGKSVGRDTVQGFLVH